MFVYAANCSGHRGHCLVSPSQPAKMYTFVLIMYQCVLNLNKKSVLYELALKSRAASQVDSHGRER